MIDTEAGHVDEAGWGPVRPAGSRVRLVPEGLTVWMAVDAEGHAART